MGSIYVRSTDGNDADSGSSWAAAKATLYGASLLDAAGDTVYVSQNHSESSASTIFFTWGGLTTLPVRVICGLDTSEPPVSATNTAVINVTGANAEIQCNGSVYVYGLNFRNNGTATCTIYLHDNSNMSQMWENCTFEMNSSTANYLALNSQAITSGDIKWKNVSVKFSGTNLCSIATQFDKFRWDGGGFLTGSVAPSPGIFYIPGTRYADIELNGVDFSQLSADVYLINSIGAGRMTLRDCKMPSAWTGSFYSGAFGFSFRGEMYNCASGNTIIDTFIQEHMGKIEDESTVVKQVGADDGVNAYSLKYSANGNANAAYSRLRGPELFIWNDITSASITLAIDIVHDGATPLNVRDIGLECLYQGDSASPLGSITSSIPTDPLLSASALASTSAIWTTTGLATPITQRIQVSMTPMQRGPIHARVIQTKDSYTVYVDPRILVV